MYAKIEYPSFPSEFEVQSELWSFFKLHNVDARGELKVNKSKKWKIVRGARFDIVVFNKNKDAVAIIEVKNSFRKDEQQNHGKITYYSQLTGLPQFTFYANDNPSELMEQMKTSKIL